MSFNGPLWDFTLSPAMPQIPDEDFLALLQKQFGVNAGNTLDFNNSSTDSVDPQNLVNLPITSESPPSDDTSPSPPMHSRRQSGIFSGGTEDEGPDAHKRKHSDDELDDEPNHKNANTSGSKKGATRRKSTEKGQQDESRLLKRKEQNRAAQRAFRERKEKHVKDLEDKVAALEAKNESAQNENENLRDLLSRLQRENMMLKESSFTFSVPKQSSVDPSTSNRGASGSSNSSPASIMHDSPNSLFSSESAPSSSTASSHESPMSLFGKDNVDFGVLPTSDASMLNLFDDPLFSANYGAMAMDLNLGQPMANTPYMTIASNPFYMSFAEQPSQPTNSTTSSTATSIAPTTFETYNPASYASWPDVVNVHDSSMGQSLGFPDPMSLDDIFSGQFLEQQAPLHFAFPKSPANSLNSVSPVSHHKSPPGSITHPSPISSGSASASPPGDGVSNGSEHRRTVDEHGMDPNCPRTKADLAQAVIAHGLSPFASNVGMQTDQMNGGIGNPNAKPLPSVSCKSGKNFPTVEQSEKNIEVLTAWRSITSNPTFKQNMDINDLCADFTAKAKCDGTKVVLEPQGVRQILDKMSMRAAEAKK